MRPRPMLERERKLAPAVRRLVGSGRLDDADDVLQSHGQQPGRRSCEIDMERPRERVRHGGQRERIHRRRRRQQTLTLEREEQLRTLLRPLHDLGLALRFVRERALRRTGVEVATLPELRERRPLRRARHDQALRRVSGGRCESAPGGHAGVAAACARAGRLPRTPGVRHRVACPRLPRSRGTGCAGFPARRCPARSATG